jgi:hypothetical protein
MDLDYWEKRADEIFESWVEHCNEQKNGFDLELLDFMVEDWWCKHEQVIAVSQTMYNGQKRRWWICAKCGKGNQPKAKNAPKKFDVDMLPPQSLYRELEAGVASVKSSLFSRARKLKKQKYYAYLLTPEWFAKRDAVMRRDNATCQYCGKRATQVHHLTYDNIYNERMEDLVAICKPCHEKIHSYQVE